MGNAVESGWIKITRDLLLHLHADHWPANMHEGPQHPDPTRLQLWSPCRHGMDVGLSASMHLRQCLSYIQQPAYGGIDRRSYHMRGPACCAIRVIGQAIPLVDGTGPLILMVMATERHVNLRKDLRA